MSYSLSNDAELPPAPKLPGISTETLRRLRRLLPPLTALVALAAALWWTRSVYTDLLWFENLGYTSVYTKLLLFKTSLFVGGAAVAGIAFTLNVHLAWSISQGPSTLGFPENFLRLMRVSALLSAGLSALIGGIVFGVVASGRWETFLLVFNRLTFGRPDPLFGLDASFYVVTLRLFHFLQGWLLGLAVTMIVLTATLYIASYSIRGAGFIPAPRMLRHAAALGAFLMLTIAAGHVLDIFELVLSDNGVVSGATYTDIHARIPVLWLLTGIAVLSAAGFGVSSYFGGPRLMVGAFSLWVIAILLAGLAYPSMFQRFQVDPNEFDRERPYIERNIEATRFAYGLDKVQVFPYESAARLDLRGAGDSRAILDNIRLWDLQPLQDAYNQLQFMELYYNFLNMDSDRYTIDGKLRQVLIAARELNSENLPPDARNWVNQQLQYTHGYGVSMSPANGFTPGEGRPEYLLKDIPIQGEFPVTRPELYYGESPVPFVIVNSALSEVNPDSDFLHYDGDGGVVLSSRLRRIAYAWQFGDVNIMLSDQVTPESRLQYRRHVQNRVRTIAPFLHLDRDPYPVLDHAGKLWWLQDAYTVTDRIPYSTRLEEGVNYIRNSVKAVVDAYNGTVEFYVVQPDDPLLRMYRRAFPSLFKDLDDMPEDLRAHIRYPVGLFTAQAQMYLRYHVTNPQVFFNQADQWAIPLETRFGKQGVQVRPSYLMLQPPGAGQEEFVLMMPFSPAGEKKNLVGWLMARNDGPHYGELLGYRLPGDPQVDGPSQVEARIENDQQISQQFTLWNGAGSEIIRGQLLVIPIDGSILYLEPLYLRSEVLEFPELKKIILADGGDVVMADSIDQGLAMLVSGEDAQPSGASLASPRPPPGPAAIDQELERMQDAVTELSEAVDELQGALEDLRRIYRGEGSNGR